MPHVRHEHDHPPADGDLDPAVQEEEDGADPGDAVREREPRLRERASSARDAGVFGAVLGAGFWPEGARCVDELDEGSAGLCMIDVR